ncbi:MAG: 2-C-methyl-D-erythritol 4-phosphate cytidylyltransferase [Chlorobi bacterium]|nr:2-C-methyl-D-erythritol 4-phosphate cytidylyltransferase [Chlorobiota bacterium]
MENYVIVVAGGSGKRMKTKTPKQFLLLNNLPVLMHTIMAFYAYNKNISIVLVLPEVHFETWKVLCEKYNFTIQHTLVKGGETRFHSVKNALNTINTNRLIAIHDGVRPLVSNKTISRCFATAIKKGNAVPAVGITDSIRQIEENKNFTVNRNNYKLIQTPQVFKSELIKQAYQLDYKEYFTDDAGLLDELGVKINLVEGNVENIKITTHTDLVIAEAILKK